jgi:hypothetical protein
MQYDQDWPICEHYNDELRQRCTNQAVWEFFLNPGIDAATNTINSVLDFTTMAICDDCKEAEIKKYKNPDKLIIFHITEGMIQDVRRKED